LAAAGIGINNAACAGSQTTGCTNVGGLRQATVSHLKILHEACTDCTIIITGGSEGGHAAGPNSHENGYKVDIGTNGKFDAFLVSVLDEDGFRTGANGGPRYKDSCGNEYVNEGNHWDITVTQSCHSL